MKLYIKTNSESDTLYHYEQSIHDVVSDILHNNADIKSEFVHELAFICQIYENQIDIDDNYIYFRDLNQYQYSNVKSYTLSYLHSFFQYRTHYELPSDIASIIGSDSDLEDAVCTTVAQEYGLQPKQVFILFYDDLIFDRLTDQQEYELNDIEGDLINLIESIIQDYLG